VLIALVQIGHLVKLVYENGKISLFSARRKEQVIEYRNSAGVLKANYIDF